MPGSVMDDIMGGGGSEESSGLGLLYDTKDFQRLKMISEISPGLVYNFTVAGMLQKRYKSKVLKQFIEEYLSFQKSRDRQGVTEYVEVLLGMRRMEEGGTEG
jgi:hypothetical protein